MRLTLGERASEEADDMPHRPWRYHLLAIAAALLVIALYLALAIPARAQPATSVSPLYGATTLHDAWSTNTDAGGP
jgi:hypothetical protein